MRPVAAGNAALGPDRQEGPDEVLVGSHPPGDAVHDDAYLLFAHTCSLNASRIMRR